MRGAAGMDARPAASPADSLTRSAGARWGSAAMILGLLVPVAGGRWGSYVGIPGTPLFAADLLVAAGFGFVMAAWARAGGTLRLAPAPKALKAASWIFAAVIALGLLRAHGLVLFTVRDALPFVYLALAPVFVHAARIVGGRRVLVWVTAASALHTLWYAPAVLGALPTTRVGLVGVDVFSIRGDYDGLVAGIAIVTAVMAPRMPALLRWSIVALSAGAVLVASSRAGLIACVVVVAVAALMSRPFRDRATGPARLGLVFLAVPVLVVAGASMGGDATWARGVERLFEETLAAGSSNTTTARVQAWGDVVEYVGADTGRRWLGDGFGSSVVADSGALAHLSGAANVRNAHSFAVNWYGLVGTLGLVASLLALVLLLGAVIRRATHFPPARIGAGVLVACVVSGAVGVILESPFGYMTAVLAIALAYANGAEPEAEPPTGERPAGAMSPLSP